MSPSEYQELVEFLTGQFTQIERQFAQVDRQFHNLTLAMDRRFTLADEQLGEFRAEVDERFREVFGHFDEIYRRLDRPPGRTRAGGERFSIVIWPPSRSA